MLARQNRPMEPVIRTPRSDELERLRAVERAAGVLFAEAGMPDVAAHEPASVRELADHVHAGRAWVVVLDGLVVGYAVADVVDGNAHLEQLSVHPDAGRRGLGTMLLFHVCAWARDHDYPAVTLTTFADLPWNAPFYAKHGFRIVAEAEIGPELRRVRDEETALGLDPEQRVCMSAALGR
jgi:GNAT superfamily N-acetyltransferase